MKQEDTQLRQEVRERLQGVHNLKGPATNAEQAEALELAESIPLPLRQDTVRWLRRRPSREAVLGFIERRKAAES